MTEPRELTVMAAARALRRGTLTAEALVHSCLQRIEQREPQVRAWVSLYAEEALEEARALDREAARGRWRGPLHGIPMGVKDIIHVQGMVTKGGTEAYEAHVAGQDAEAVARLRAAGAIVLGKTVSTSFAYLDARETRNPWDLSRTPGGSSSGSGAAVGDRMCLAALGTQTGGSNLRPGAFNGVPAFKPTIGEIPTGGVLPLSWTMDHVGAIAREVADLHLLWRVMQGAPRANGDGRALPGAVRRRTPARLWRIREHFDEHSSPEVRAHLDDVCRDLQHQGVRIVEAPLPASFAGLLDSWKAILAGETMFHHQERWAAREQLYPPHFAALLREAAEQRTVVYLNALAHRARFLADVAEVLAGVDAAVLPTTPAPPPDPGTTGDASFLVPWTMCGFPALSLPSALSAEGLPLAVQLVAPHGGDAALLGLGRWCEGMLAFRAAPA